MISVRAAVKTDAQNQFFIDEIERAGNEVVNRVGTQVAMLTDRWKKAITDANSYALAKNSDAHRKFSPGITRIQEMLNSRSLDELKASAELSATLRNAVRTEGEKIKASVLTPKEKRWALERYEAIFDALNKIAEEKRKRVPPPADELFNHLVAEGTFGFSKDEFKKILDSEKGRTEWRDKPLTLLVEKYSLTNPPVRNKAWANKILSGDQKNYKKWSLIIHPDKINSFLDAKLAKYKNTPIYTRMRNVALDVFKEINDANEILNRA